MESSDSIDKSWDTTSDTTTTAMRSDPLASEGQPPSTPGGWMVNVAGRDIVEMSHADVVSRWRNGELLGNVLVWREGMESWARLESVPAFQIIEKPPADELPTAPEDANPVAVYERPMATLVFDEAVEDEWKGAKTREPSKTVRGSEPSKGARSASTRPPAPELPPLAPRRSPVVPVDDPPPPPPLPPRRSLPAGRPSARPPMPTIPGGLAPPSPRPASVSPAKSPLPLASAAAPKTSSPPRTASPANSPIPAGPPSSPLLAAIAAAASSPEPVVVAQAPPPPLLDEVSVSARLRAMKSVSLRNAVFACVGSALVASLVTGLVVGSRTRAAARRSPEPPAKVVAAPPVAPSPVPTPAPAPTPAQAPTAEVAESASAEKVALSDLPEKPKPKPVKVSAWKAPKPATPANPDSTLDGPAPNPSRDDPERAVPDRVVDRPAQPANWQADPGF